MTVEALVSCAAVATLLMILVLRLRRGPVPQGVVGGPVDSLPLPPPEPPVSYETTAAPAPASEAAPEAAPAAEKILPWHARLSWPQAKVYQRVRSYEFEQMDGTRSPCTASNATLGQGWYEDGRPAGDRYVRLLLRGLHDAGVLGGWDGAERRHSSSNPTGRGLRTLAGPLPAEIAEHVSAPARLSGGSPPIRRARSGSYPDHGRIMPGSDPPIRISDGVGPDESSKPGPAGPPPTPAAATHQGPRVETPGPTGGTSPASERLAGGKPAEHPDRDEAKQIRIEACSRRKNVGIGYFAELTDEQVRQIRCANRGVELHRLHVGAQSCAECLELGGWEEQVLLSRDTNERATMGYIFPSTLAMQSAVRGHLPLDEVAPPQAAAPTSIATTSAPPRPPVRIVASDGQPAYHDGVQWIMLTEEQVTAAVVQGWAVDDRPPPPPPEVPSTWVKPEPRIVPPEALPQHAFRVAEGVMAEVRAQVGSAAELVAPVFARADEMRRDPAGAAILDALAPLQAAAAVLDRTRPLDVNALPAEEEEHDAAPPGAPPASPEALRLWTQIRAYLRGHLREPEWAVVDHHLWAVSLDGDVLAVWARGEHVRAFVERICAWPLAEAMRRAQPPPRDVRWLIPDDASDDCREVA